MFLISKYIKNYGFKNFIKIFLLELIYVVKFFDLKNLNVKKFNTTVQSKRRKFYFKEKKYNEVGPSSYYALKFILSNLAIINNENSVIFDFGCGDCRVARFFFKSYFYGFDIDRKYLVYNKLKNAKIYNVDLRNIKKRKIIFDKLKISKNKNIVLYFADPFEINLVNKIISYFKKKYKKVYVILINTPNINLFDKKKFFVRKKKVFLNKKRNIFILETIV
jgi:hypothetical protein